jgi:SAM-dependent methyltransferase
MKNIIKKFYITITPFFNIKALIENIKNIIKSPVFLFDFFKYKLSSKEKVKFIDIYPCLDDKSSKSQTGKGHYFYQDIWAMGHIYKSKVPEHIDIGSRIDGFVGQCSVFCNIEMVDLRPVDLGLGNINFKEGSILNLPYENNSVSSLSCLHVIEHIGLGRYGDDVDNLGSVKSAKELQRVLSNNGSLYLGVPIGEERVCFNAHRVFNPNTVVSLFQDLTLKEFKAVNDNGYFVDNADIDSFDNANYSCGLFHFVKK